MLEAPRATPEPSSGDLLETYLAARDRGDRAAAEALLARAGPDAPGLRAELDALRRIEALAGLVADEHTAGPDLNELGRFQDLELLGEGGLSRVFRAYDPRLERVVALKVLEPRTLSGDDAREGTLLEARSLARLEHESIVRVFEADAVGGLAYIAMELVDGPSLFAVLETLRGKRVPDDGAPDPRRAAAGLESVAARCRLVARVARALEYCHARGMVHRDVKPGNVLIDANGTPKLIDFGLAHLDAAGASLGLTQRLVGTAAYVAPEQVRSGRTGARPASDQFALGVVLYELLTLHNPFARERREETLAAIERSDAPPPRARNPALPRDVDLICRKAMAPLPADRYADIGALASDLEAFLDHRAIAARPPSALAAARLFARRNRRQVVGAALALAAVVAALAVGRLARARSDRSELEQQLATLDARVPEARLAGDFQRLYGELDGDLERARTLDRSTLGRLVFAPVEAHVRARLRAVSDRMGEVLAEEHRLLDRSRFPSGSLRRELARDYETALALDDRLCPECPANRVDRGRGSVDLPPLADGAEVRVARHVPGLWYRPDGLAERPFEARLPTGVYRLEVLEAGRVVAARDFEVLPELERRTLFVERPQAEGALRVVPYAPEVDAEQRRDPDVRGTPLPAVRVLPRAVTWERLWLALGESGVRVGSLAVYGDPRAWLAHASEPAQVSWLTATAYARAVGGCLPTVLELRSALEAPWACQEPELSAEWTSVPDVGSDQRVQLKYDALDERVVAEWTSSTDRDGVVPGTGFRLVFPD